MTLNEIRKKVARTGVSDVSKLTNIPARTLYRFTSGKNPSMRTYQALLKWAQR